MQRVSLANKTARAFNTTETELNKKSRSSKGFQQSFSVAVDDSLEPEGSFAFVFMNSLQIDALIESKDEETLEKRMAEILGFKDYDLNLKEACVLDYYLNCFHWASTKKWSNKALSGFMTMMDNILSNIRDQKLKKIETIMYIKHCLAGLGQDMSTVEITPYPLYFITAQQGKMIFLYLTRTLLVNYSLYEHVLQWDQDEFIIGRKLEVLHCTPNNLFPLPLSEAIPLDAYEKYLNREEDINSEAEESPSTIEESPYFNVEDSEDEIVSPEDEFVEAVAKQIKETDHKSVKGITYEELRRAILKFTKGVIFPQKKKMSEKIKHKEVLLLEKINNDRTL